MSCGQAAWADEKADAAYEEHKARLAALSPSELISIVDKLVDHFQLLEVNLISLPRSGWYQLDEIRKQLRRLQ